MADIENRLYAMRHSAAHVLATAVKHLHPEVKLGVGPVVENGFYYDFDLGDVVLSEDDLPKIEAEMAKIISANQQFVKDIVSLDEAVKWAHENNQPYKLELLNDLKRSGTTDVKDIDSDVLGTENGGSSAVDTVSFYTNGDFKDLCRGPHVESTGEVGPFKLMRVSGAYWRGNEKNKQLQRVYGLAYETKDELDNYLKAAEQAKMYDHRKLGQELDLFVISPLVGSGLPLFTPRGTVLRQELSRFSEEMRARVGCEFVWTPHIAKQELYETSGHWAKFGDEWLTVTSKETKDRLVMKPMSCPHHQQIYGSRKRSYRDLPIKYMETATVYRDEKAGELLGLSRVRSITQDDTHIFCTPDQINEVIGSLVDITKEFYSLLGLEVRARLSLRDNNGAYLGDKDLWDKAQTILKSIADEKQLNYFVAEGEAAFYGPKIDFMATDALGRELQLATPQLDFVQPERFGLSYTDQDGSEKTPVMVHFAMLGSIERFLSAYIEHVMGKFPVWLAPEQIRIVTLNQTEAIKQYASEVLKKAKEKGLRAIVDNDNESVGKKVRQAEVMKVPYCIVIGPKEVETTKVAPRVRQDLTDKKDIIAIDIDRFLDLVQKEYTNRAVKSSL